MLGDLGLGLPLEVHSLQERALLVGEGAEGVLEAGLVVARDRLEDLGDSLGGAGHGSQAGRLAPGGVEGSRADPVAEHAGHGPARGVEALGLVPEANEDLLDDVLGPAGVLEDPASQGYEARGPLGVQLLEGLLVPLVHGRHEFLVGSHSASLAARAAWGKGLSPEGLGAWARIRARIVA